MSEYFPLYLLRSFTSFRIEPFFNARATDFFLNGMNGNDLPFFNTGTGRHQLAMSVIRLWSPNSQGRISKSPTFHTRGAMADKCKIVYNYELTLVFTSKCKRSLVFQISQALGCSSFSTLN